MEGILKTFIFLGGDFVGPFARPLRQPLYISVQRVFFILHEYSSSGQAIFYKSIARVKGDMLVN